MNFPVSIKGIIIREDNVLLLKNERNEWELPGGRLEKGEAPQKCLIREIKEELNIDCTVKQLVDTWVYEVLPGKQVFIVIYYCECDDFSQLKISEEHVEYGWVSLSKLKQSQIPEGYLNSIFKVI
ncbi:NUDIX domain-containing protein [Paenactinomyces guangxiensis]|uniref:NUDIX domain-containing protein n=1 Tax=Paenactinomyces guangxiensis TaxID=1490290 RepID=A0A7W1WR99_9BACL|nr:NUDIX domain-containing protein [Paenactinomyces guangxiensis]MBA4494459.1 NUDIX domain-containing protein [Paenactinomyces guangxiensis]MBH8591486.1 NUDIX domain-containing protein [Paenactinomyces guangxiensis]